MSAVENVLIVGGGIAGMTLAIGLHRAGIAAEIVEISPQWIGLGTGISLQGATLRALRSIGLLEPCIARGFGYSHFRTCDVNGKVLGTVDMPRLLGPGLPATVGIMRQEVHAAMREALTAAGIPARTGTTVATLEQDPDGVEVSFTDGANRRYDLVVGADGANSKIRDMVFGPQFRSQYTGQVNWRGTVSRPPEVQGRYSWYGPRNKAGVNPVSERQMYIYIVQNAEKPPRYPDEQLPDAMRELLADFGGFMGAARDEVTDPQHVICRPITSSLMPQPWYRGRVIVIGDAAHTTTPHMATGAGMAVEDSIVLAELLQSEPSLSGALESFMQRRYERCRMVVENSFQLGEWEKDPSVPNSAHVALVDRSLKALAQPI